MVRIFGRLATIFPFEEDEQIYVLVSDELFNFLSTCPLLVHVGLVMKVFDLLCPVLDDGHI